MEEYTGEENLIDRTQVLYESGPLPFDTRVIEDDEMMKIRGLKKNRAKPGKKSLMYRHEEDEDRPEDDDFFHFRRYRRYRPKLWVIILSALVIAYAGMSFGYHLMASAGGLHGIQMQHDLKGGDEKVALDAAFAIFQHATLKDRFGFVLRNATPNARTEVYINCPIWSRTVWSPWKETDYVACGLKRWERRRMIVNLFPNNFNSSTRITCPATHEYAFNQTACHTRTGVCNTSNECVLKNEDDPSSCLLFWSCWDEISDNERRTITGLAKMTYEQNKNVVEEFNNTLH
ncbi:hypothetical protein M3Y96_00168700 [Aphelenchoides besseyi]|nr:hypothetical protein M3Y96_00168700 [Aphelenchoides besseyi]